VFALVRGYVVFASDTASITAMIDRDSSGKDTLEQNARFKTVLANLPKTAVGYVYLDGPPVADLIDSMMKQTISAMPGSQAGQLEAQLKNLKAMQGMGLALSVVDEGVQLDSAASFDLTKLDKQMADQIEAARIPVDAAQLQNISDNAVALVTFKIPSTFKDQMMEALKAQPNAEEALKEFEQQTELSLEHDVLDWLAGDASLVVLPGEKLGDTTIPVTGYFVLRPQDKNAAEAGLKKIAATIEKTLGSEEVRFEQESIAGVDWQVIKEPQSQQSVVGYGFTKDEVVIAFGKTALTAAGGGHDSPIVNEDTFKAVNGKLLSPNGGLLYVNVANAVDIADKLGVGNEDSSEQQAFRKNIKPIKAVGLAAGPGIDKDGLSHGRLFVLIADK